MLNVKGCRMLLSGKDNEEGRGDGDAHGGEDGVKRER